MIGLTIGHYRVVQRLGAGGMGEVYLARDLQLDRDVALKLLPSGTIADDSARRQFRQEAVALAKLNHPNIATVYEFNTHDGVDFIAMELIAGSTLLQKIEHGALPQAEVLQLGIQLADGLAVAHAQGVVHRDLKPQNVMVTAEGRLKILDFGLSKFLARSQDLDITQNLSAATGVIVGTVPYMAPEQLLGKGVDARSDIYGAGAVLYELAAGRRPFAQKTNVEMIGAILHESAPPPSSFNATITPALDGAILKAIAKEPWRRHRNAETLRAALSEIAGNSSGIVAAPRRSRIARLAAAPALVGIGALLFVLNVGGVRDRIAGRRTATAGSAVARGRQSVAVLGFKNISGRQDEAWLSTALSEMLSTELAAGEQLRTIPGENVARMKMNLSLPEADSYGRDTLARIRRNLDADHVVLGSYIPLGAGQVRLDVRLQDTNAGDILIATSVKGEEAQIDALVSSAGAALRNRLGVGDVSAAQAVAVRATSPPSRDAARFYSIGLQRLREFDYQQARESLEQAVQVSPQFALAHSALAAAWKGLGYDRNATEEAARAVELSKDFSREIRLSIRGQAEETANKWADAIATYRTLVDFFPDNLDYGLRLVSCQTSASKGTDALATVAALRRLPPPSSDDARIDVMEAGAAASVGDFKRQQAAAATAIGKADAQGARLLAALARISECSAFRYLGEPQKSIATCEEARRIFSDGGDRTSAARALNNIAVVQMEQGNLTEARKSYEQSLAAIREVGDKRQEAIVLNNLAGVLRGQVDLAGSRKMLESALGNFREVGDRGGVVRSLDNIGIVLLDEGKPDEARKQHEAALAICRDIGNKGLLGYTLYLLGEIHSVQGNLAASRKSQEEAMAVRQEIGDPRGIADSGLALARLLVEAGQLAPAETAAREQADRFQKLKMSGSEAQARGLLASVLMARGRADEARTTGEQALTLAQKAEDVSPRLAVAIDVARVRLASRQEKDTAEAIAMLEKATADAKRDGLTGLRLQATLALGEAELQSGRRAEGRARLAALRTEANAKGFVLIARKAAAAR